MSGIARKIQRHNLHRGKLSEAEYRAFRTPVDVGARDDAVNAPIRRHATALRGLLAQAERLDVPEVVSQITNELRHLSLRAIEYHPTKGYRSYRGLPV